MNFRASPVAYKQHEPNLELLIIWRFGSAHHALERLAQWHDRYDLPQPHSALDDRTPASLQEHQSSSGKP